ncbi:hypothetical protein AAXE64_27220 [Priestia megaterium]
MIVQYNKITPEHRSLVRSIESKSYVNYIRYLLLKRWPFERIKQELMRLGLAWDDKESYDIYFSEVLYPRLKKTQLSKYYKSYHLKLPCDTLTITSTFVESESDRIAFIDLLKSLGLEQFFAEEIVDHYQGLSNIPTHPSTGELLIEEKPVDLVEVLQNPKRHVIERSLVDGYSPEQISDYLYQMYELEVTPQEIKMYAKSFFNVTRQDIHRLVENLQNEKADLEKRLTEMRHMPAAEFSFGERYEVLSTMKNKITQLGDMIKRLSSMHTNTSFNAAVLETTDMRDAFKDVFTRTYRRYRDLDERTEDEVVKSLNTVVNMMTKVTDKILSIDDVLSQKVSKSVNEQIIEAVMPTLERIEEEEREAMYAFKQANLQAQNDSEDDSDHISDEDDGGIIGFD